MLTVEELDTLVADGTIDTVLVVFPDLQGRLMGKRVTGHYWVDHMNSGRVPIHACNYLLAVDAEMTVLPGYEFANWEQGYGDVALQPDLTTLRRIPWLEATALVMCDARRRARRATGRGLAAAHPRSGRSSGRPRSATR